MRNIQIGNFKETVVERADYPPERLKAILGNETVAVLGYGVQGRGQSLNMKDNGVKVIVVEPYFDLKTPNSVARQTGGQVVVLMPSVGGEKEITDYFKLFDYDIAKLKQALDTVH